MSFYEPQGWQAPVRQSSWEQPAPPSRSGASSTSQRDDGNAFATQYEEVDRAIDNLVKSGKFYSPGPRRESLPVMAGGSRQFGEHGHRVHGSNRHSVSDFDPARPSASNVQNFYASQRYQGRHSEAEQMLQAKRRMAAQRERELRNYHQEQQYNRIGVLSEMASNKSDRSMSPSTLSEEGRRELIARQHRALYGNDSASYLQQPGYGEENIGREQGANIPTSAAGGVRGSSPKGMDPFGMAGQLSQVENSGPGVASGQEAARGEKAGSPTNQMSASKAPTPPANEESAHSRQISKSTTAPLPGGMGPIGSRPSTQHAPVQSISKRTTSPLPSSLNYGFTASDQSNERSGSSNSNSNAQKDNASNSSMAPWGTGSGVWGSNKIGATSVWG